MNNLSHDTHKTYRLYFFNLEDVSRGYWRSKVSKKGVKKSQIEFKMPGICQKIILHPNYDTYEFNFWYV